MLREAKAVRCIRHPHIVRVYDVGTADGWWFVEMEFMSGGSLKKRIEQQGPMHWREAVCLVSQALSGLSEVHRRGIVHRDVKASNILLDERGRAKLSDFGLCRPLGDSTITGAREILGSPHYMAPEQWRGERPCLQSDIYGMGVVLYFLVTGRVPFESEDMLGLMYQHLHAAAPEAHARNPSVPVWLSQVIRKATEKNISMRYRSADEFLGEVRPLL